MKTSSLSIVRSRGVERLVRGQPTSDGAGVKLTRVLTQPLQQRLDPFLMLDAFGSDAASDYIGGFPDHPHRGFETVTIMKAGRMRHHDSVGNTGLLEPGSVQWMTAGRGIIHSEMPEQEEGRMAGFQLWVNLAARDKMQPPAYRDVPPAQVPAFELEGGTQVRVIAGTTHGVGGAVTRPTTEPLVLDIVLPAGAVAGRAGARRPQRLRLRLRRRGGGDRRRAGRPASTWPSWATMRRPTACASARRRRERAAQILLVAGAPLREPIAQYGPFVMNTVPELHQAVADFQRGVLAT